MVLVKASMPLKHNHIVKNVALFSLSGGVVGGSLFTAFYIKTTTTSLTISAAVMLALLSSSSTCKSASDQPQNPSMIELERGLFAASFLLCVVSVVFWVKATQRYC